MHEDGFALVEVLVAAAVIATMMALTYTVQASNAMAAHEVIDRREALMVAQSVLAQAMEPAGSSLDGAGAGGRMLWHIAITPFDRRARGNGPPLEQVTVTVANVETHRPLLSLSSLRLAQ